MGKLQDVFGDNVALMLLLSSLLLVPLLCLWLGVTAVVSPTLVVSLVVVVVVVVYLSLLSTFIVDGGTFVWFELQLLLLSLLSLLLLPLVFIPSTSTSCCSVMIMGGQGGQGGWVLCCIVFLFCNFVPADRCRPALFCFCVCACLLSCWFFLFCVVGWLT